MISLLRMFCLFLTATLKPFSDPICMATFKKEKKKKASNPLKYLKRHMTTFTACTYYDAWPVLHVTEAIIRRTVPAAVWAKPQSYFPTFWLFAVEFKDRLKTKHVRRRRVEPTHLWTRSASCTSWTRPPVYVTYGGAFSCQRGRRKKQQRRQCSRVGLLRETAKCFHGLSITAACCLSVDRFVFPLNASSFLGFSFHKLY